ncbi:MAG TPA: DegT/DnrJ/EryC1/StrS family aminotransferase [Actinomycetota bacterium]|nr:DegT/DnrJ/EryC1/StrS family aminotransferase [Actinomycetota bacterium]
MTEGMHRPWPEIRPEDREAVTAVLDRGTLFGPTAPEIAALERDWAAYLGRNHCVATNSGTAALHCALAAVGVRPGDEVIVPAFTFVATALSVLHQGARPVFCDVDPRTFNLDPGRVEELVTDRTTAIMPVHLHGLPADMDEILAIAERNGLAVVEDAAQAHGATYRGRKVGTLGACAGFSLNTTKTLPGGEGGLFVTDDEDAWLVARRLSNFGEDVPPAGADAFRPYLAHGIGWMYRSHELPAAFARSQLRRLDGYVETARRNASILTEGLRDLPGLVPPYVPNDRTHTFHKYRLRLDPEALGLEGRVGRVEFRDRMLRALRAEGVEAVLWQFVPLPALPVFRRAEATTWHPRIADEPAPWRPEDHPVAVEVLETSIVVGSERYPLAVQDATLMERYVDAFAKVLGDLDALLAAPYEPIVHPV